MDKITQRSAASLPFYSFTLSLCLPLLYSPQPCPPFLVHCGWSNGIVHHTFSIFLSFFFLFDTQTHGVYMFETIIPFSTPTHREGLLIG